MNSKSLSSHAKFIFALILVICLWYGWSLAGSLATATVTSAVVWLILAGGQKA